MKKPQFFILDENKDLKKVDCEEWAKWMTMENRIQFKDVVYEQEDGEDTNEVIATIQTLFLGVDLYGGLFPDMYMFSTVVTDWNDNIIEQKKSTTYAKANSIQNCLYVKYLSDD